MENILINNDNVIIGFADEYIEDTCGQALYMIREMDLGYIESLEELREKAQDAMWEHADGLVPIYSNRIREEFGKLNDWEVDDLACSYEIEYHGESFEKFQMAILFVKYHKELQEELSELMDALIENNKEELREEAKNCLEDAYNEELENLLIDNAFYIDRGLFNSVFEHCRLLTDEARAYVELHYDAYLY